MNSKTYTIQEITQAIESIAPCSYQEDYDNAGLIVGSPQQKVDKAIVALDATEEVVDEAIAKQAQLIIAHHPIVFKGLKRFNGRNYVERAIIKAIKNDIAIYAVHTNLDNVPQGVNAKIAEKIGLSRTRILQPMSNDLRKLVTFIPKEHTLTVSKAVFDAGAGHIGNYDQCGYTTNGLGSFRALEGAAPFVGNPNSFHQEEESRFETIFPAHKQSAILNALTSSHPYEEVAYDIYPLKNLNPKAGAGMIGELETAEDELTFLQRIKSVFRAGCVKYTPLKNKPIKKVAICGGSGSFLLKKAIATDADVFVSSDFKYHDYFDAENKILIADIGHFESEQFTKELILEIVTEKIPNFAAYISEVKTSPVNYL